MALPYPSLLSFKYIQLYVPFCLLGKLYNLTSVSITPVPEILLPQNRGSQPILFFHKCITKLDRIIPFEPCPCNKIQPVYTDILNIPFELSLLKGCKHHQIAYLRPEIPPGLSDLDNLQDLTVRNPRLLHRQIVVPPYDKLTICLNTADLLIEKIYPYFLRTRHFVFSFQI